MAHPASPKRATPRETFERYLELFYTHCRGMNYAPRTIDEFYRHEFQAFRRYLEANQLDPYPEEVTPDLIRAFLANRQLTRSSVTARHGWQVLSVWFKYLAEEEIIAKNPMERIEKPKVRTIVMKTYSRRPFTDSTQGSMFDKG